MGRRPGSKNKKTLEKEKAMELSQEQAMDNADTLPLLVPEEGDESVQFLEYISPDGSRWRIEDGVGCEKEFNVGDRWREIGMLRLLLKSGYGRLCVWHLG